MTTRRTFLAGGAALFGGAALAPSLLARSSQDVEPAAKALDVLVLGGTGFIGPHQIGRLLARGHRVTMFNRGRRSGMYGDRVEELQGDRDANVGEGLKALHGGRRWDAVIDNSGYVPRHIRDSAELLAERCGRYLYTSTVAVYDYERAPLVDGAHVAGRDSALYAAPEPATEQVDGETYGPLKAEGDRIVREIYGDRATCVRPTYIVGPGDTTDRFTYWVERLRRGGDVVCPAGPDRFLEWIDVRDLCNFMVKLIEDGTPGAFNGVGPATPMTNEEVMLGLRAFASAPTRLHWPTPEVLEELRFNTPMCDPFGPNHRTDAGPAVAAGLEYRSLADTVRDTHEWWTEQSEERRGRARGWPSEELEAKVVERARG
ncbi:MAG: NAD-dependent epimerase/dehydratase family protein [Planctomycetota bacterium]